MSDFAIKMLCLTLIIVAIVIALAVIFVSHADGSSGTVTQLGTMLVLISGFLANYLKIQSADAKAEVAAQISKDNAAQIEHVATDTSRTKEAIEKVVEHTNGMKESLLAATKAGAFAEGKVEGLLQPKSDHNEDPPKLIT